MFYKSKLGSIRDKMAEIGRDRRSGRVVGCWICRSVVGGGRWSVLVSGRCWWCLVWKGLERVLEHEGLPLWIIFYIGYS